MIMALSQIKTIRQVKILSELKKQAAKSFTVMLPLTLTEKVGYFNSFQVPHFKK
jgi:hypothetical protein